MKKQETGRPVAPQRATRADLANAAATLTRECIRIELIGNNPDATKARWLRHRLKEDFLILRNLRDSLASYKQPPLFTEEWTDKPENYQISGGGERPCQ